MEKKTIKLTVKRSNPLKQDRDLYQTYEIPFTSGLSVMNALDYIEENLDRTLAYYSHSACYRGVCGRCMITIDGRARLACATILKSDATLEPPRGSLVIRDLVYEMKNQK